MIYNELYRNNRTVSAGVRRTSRIFLILFLVVPVFLVLGCPTQPSANLPEVTDAYFIESGDSSQTPVTTLVQGQDYQLIVEMKDQGSDIVKIYTHEVQNDGAIDQEQTFDISQPTVEYTWISGARTAGTTGDFTMSVTVEDEHGNTNATNPAYIYYTIQ
jgi:hypothetical protein